MELFSGTYELTETSKQFLFENESFKENPELVIRLSGTYKFDGVEGVTLAKRGTWKTEEEYGKWIFYTEDGNFSECVDPATNGITATLSFKYHTKEDNWKGIQSILFVKEL